jgi:hypothetical protein
MGHVGEEPAAKIAIFAAPFVSAVIGMLILWRAGREQRDGKKGQGVSRRTLRGTVEP